jgi:hypothetical protein
LDAGAKDNFVIDETSGLISVAPDSVLDIQQNGDTYQIKASFSSKKNDATKKNKSQDRCGDRNFWRFPPPFVKNKCGFFYFGQNMAV